MVDFQTYIIDTLESWEDLKQYVDEEKFDIISLDVETNSEKEKVAILYGIGLCFQPGQAFYIPIREQNGREWWYDTTTEDIRNKIYDWCKRLKLIGYNVLYDVLVLENNWGLDFSPFIYSDPMLQKHMLDEERPFKLKEVAVKYLGDWADKAEEQLKENVLSHGGRWVEKHKDMYLADTHILAEYCCWDTILCRLLFDKFEPQILDNPTLSNLFYRDEVMPLYREVTVNMKRHGFKVNVPHFEALKENITRDIKTVEQELLTQLGPDIEQFINMKLDKEVPVKTGGNFPKALGQVLELELPVNQRTGTVTLSRKVLEERRHSSAFYSWMLDECSIEKVASPRQIKQAQELLYFSKAVNKDKTSIFNLASTDHLGWLFFEKYGCEPLFYTDGGESGNKQPKVDEDFLLSVQGEVPFVSKLLEYRKLNKLLSTYIEGVLERHIDGIIYTSMLQHGTTSGRYASANLNMQNLPAVPKEAKDLVSRYTSAIREGYICEEGQNLVASDFNSLEPHLAAYVSGDPGLIDVFTSGKDFYSAIGIRQFGITDAHPYKDGTPDSFAVKYPELRNLVKTYSLAAFYGATPPRISQVINEEGKMTKKEAIIKAEELLGGYFKAFPLIPDFIESTHWEAKTKGFVSTAFGRQRHLWQLKALYEKYGNKLLDWRWANANDLKVERGVARNLLNNSVNVKIQGLAAHAANRSMLLAQRQFRKEKLKANIILMIHDELIAACDKSEAKRTAEIIKWAMENCLDLSPIKLKANPVICQNLGEAKG